MPSRPSTAVTGIEPSRTARPMSAQIRIGRRSSRSTHAPAKSPTIRPAMSSTDRSAAISPAPASRTRIAANGSAVRVMSDPKIEMVLADQTATKLRSRHSAPLIGGGGWASVIDAEG